MVKLIFLLTTLVHFGAYGKTLNCEFGMFDVPIMQTITDLSENDEIGESSIVTFNGASKTVPNLVLPLDAGDRYHFAFDEGAGDQNVYILVHEEKSEEGLFMATAVNPQTPMLKEMNGLCQFNN